MRVRFSLAVAAACAVTAFSAGAAHAQLSLPALLGALTLSPANQVATADTSLLDFGSSNLLAPAYRSVDIVNRSNAPVIYSTTIVGDGGFTLDSRSTCVGHPNSVFKTYQLVQPGEHCSLVVAFYVERMGVANATLNLLTHSETEEAFGVSGPHYQLSVKLTATRSSPLTIIPTLLSFGQVTATFQTRQLSTTLKNVSTEVVPFFETLSGAADFTAGYGNCPGASANYYYLNPGESCVVPAVFAPQTPGSRSASLAIADSVYGIPLDTVQLTGQGTALNATVSPTTLSFPATVFGPDHLFRSTLATTVTNNADGITFVPHGSILTGADDFQVDQSGGQADSCYNAAGNAKPLGSGTSCQIYVFFSPETSGAKTGSLVVKAARTDNGAQPLTLATVSLNGSTRAFPSD